MQTVLCMVLMIINNWFWVRRKSFLVCWHSTHYYFASAILLLYLPRMDLWPSMLQTKLQYTVINILIFQLILGKIAALTSTHQLITMLITQAYLLVLL